MQCVVSRDIPIIIQDLRKRGVVIAISSRNTNKNMWVYILHLRVRVAVSELQHFRTNRALWYIKIRDSRDNTEKPLTDFLSYIEVEDGKSHPPNDYTT